MRFEDMVAYPCGVSHMGAWMEPPELRTGDGLRPCDRGELAAIGQGMTGFGLLGCCCDQLSTVPPD
jgi:hypothetical protein